MSDSYHVPRSEYRQRDIDDMIEKAVAAERERCAKIVRDLWHDPEGAYTADYVENAIRNSSD